MNNLVYQFCNRKYLTKKHVIRIERNTNRDYVYLEDPIVLARLAGHLKHNLGQPLNGYQVFMRGQSNDYPRMQPSMCRNIDCTQNNFQVRYEAYEKLVSEIRNVNNLKRFQGEIGGAILQHYGIRTPWLDLVDNLFIALWFACHNRTNSEPFQYIPRSLGEFGWIYFLRLEDPMDRESIFENHGVIVGENSKWCDLRCYQTSLSLRAHTQHGIFASRSNLDNLSYDLGDFVVSAVKFPVTREFISLLNEFIPFSTAYMFPSSYYDNTYKNLRQGKVHDLIIDIERSYGLDEGELGRINTYDIKRKKLF